LLPIYRKKQRKPQPEYLVAQFQYNKSDDPPRRNLKTTGRWHKKGRTEQSGYQFKYRTPLQNCPVNHLCTRAGREIDREVCRGVEENNKRYQENPVPNGRRLTNIFGTIKNNGVTITNLTGLEK
jgi:hypothetical protein